MMHMKLILLGTTGYHPNDRRETPCLLVPDCGIMLDAGTAVYRAGRYLEGSELSFNVVREHPLDRIVLYGEPQRLAAIDEHLFSEHLFPLRPSYEARPLPDEVALARGGTLTHFPLEHEGGSVGYRLDWPGHSMAYVTDTTAHVDADYVDKIRGVDLLVHECYFSDAQAEWAERTGHSCTTPVAQVARKAEVGRLVLVHINPLCTGDDPIGLPTARAIFPRTEIGEDFMELSF